MSRFFKSAAFPILIVVVLAFFISKVFVSPAQKGPEHTYRTLVTEDIPGHRVKSAVLKVKDNSVAVTLNSTYKEEKYEVGFVDQQVPKLEEELKKAGTKFNVESNKTSHLAVAAHLSAAARLDPRLLVLPDQSGPGRGLARHVLRQVARQAPLRRLPQDHVP